jgi:hypothetical protein
VIPPSIDGTPVASNYGSVPVKIAETVLGASATSVTFSSIPAGFRHLELIWQVRTDVAAVGDFMVMQFNGDTAANYNWHQLIGNNNTAGDNTTPAATELRASQAVGGNGAPGQAGIGRLTIPNYAGTTFYKSFVSVNQAINTGGAANFWIVTHAGTWSSAAALNAILLKPATGPNFVAGSVFSLYGLP